MLSLQLAHQMANRHVLLVGCGTVGMTRVHKLIPTGCKLTIISPENDEELLEYLPESEHNVEDKSSGQDSEFINHDWTPEIAQVYHLIRRQFQDSDISLHKFEIVLTCLPSGELSTHIYDLCKRPPGNGIMCNVADVPNKCDFYFGSNCLLGSQGLQIMISSNGCSPRLTALLKEDIIRRYQGLEWDEMCKRLGDLRAQVREKSAGMEGFSKQEIIRFRMEWIKHVTTEFGLDNCAQIDVPKLCDLFDTMALKAADHGKEPTGFPDSLVQEYSENPKRIETCEI
ncbi:bifunctional precorrin-2 dehydrogenase/sirohydrochlorin ferrochelatase MET8 Ecym_3081 [Eremothecium cymbalariae DBVPG|uniref:precorrin-2 dehydrogenase n=1 Tax=Eremothecium cymbalariae (strain CBS 270.75 / DBVPG 7215 / KCTC 17166 / NRRL Y-17582) TaxID=931890 RepID=G8JR24_ERECY|nr:Hypothetical protein Ecym_3081 [Eremothecium cymbalariae DBVPG\